MTVKTSLQEIMLRSLHNQFGVDVAPATGLEGEALDSWIDAAEDALFLKLQHELREQTADRELARKELQEQYDKWKNELRGDNRTD